MQVSPPCPLIKGPGVWETLPHRHGLKGATCHQLELEPQVCAEGHLGPPISRDVEQGLDPGQEVRPPPQARPSPAPAANTRCKHRLAPASDVKI